MNQKFALKASVLALGTAIVFSMNANAQAVQGTAYAQNGPTYTATAQKSQSAIYQDVMVHLNLQNVVEFVVNKNFTEILFDNYTKYTNGTETQEDEQFTVSSNRPFEITIMPLGGTFVNGQNTIPVKDVDLTANNLSNTWNGTIQNQAQTFVPTAAGVALKDQTDQLLFSSNGALNDKFGVLYHATGGKDFIVPPGVYDQTVRFTLTQK